MKSTRSTISRNWRELKTKKRFLRDRWLPILEVHTHTHTVCSIVRDRLFTLSRLYFHRLFATRGTDTTVAYGTAVLKAPIYSRTFLIASHRWELFPGTCRLTRAPLCYRDSLSSRSVASAVTAGPRPLCKTNDNFSLSSLTLANSRCPRHIQGNIIYQRNIISSVSVGIKRTLILQLPCPSGCPAKYLDGIFNNLPVKQHPVMRQYWFYEVYWFFV